MRIITYLSCFVLLIACSGGNEANRLFQEGRKKLSANDNKGAIADFNKSIELKAGNDSIYVLRANAYKALGNDKAALADYDKAIELNPTCTMAYNNRGLLKGRMQDSQGELDDYNKVLEYDSLYYLAYYNRGNIYFDAGKLQAALKDYSKAIELKPDYSNAVFNRANVYDELKDYQAALENYNRYFEILHNAKKDEQDPEGFYLRGNDKVLLKDTAGACADWKRANDLGYIKADEQLKAFCK